MAPENTNKTDRVSEHKASLKHQYQAQVAQEESEMYDIGEGARRDMLSDD